MPISLYRKWRPQKFSEVVNQYPVIKTLMGALSQNRISHAYLFTGPKGTGKTTVARLLAKAVNCTRRKKDHFEPCNKCESCQEISEGRSLDFFEIDAASHRGIDEIRDLIEKIKFTPAKAQYKVFVIDESHMLTREAFNALLKTLEEPPAHAIFILATTEAHKIPPTILSRCQRFDFTRISLSQIQKQLEFIAQKEKIKIKKDGSKLLAQNSEGSLRDAIGFLDQLRVLTKNNITIQDIEYVLGLTSQKSVIKFLDLIFQAKTKSAIELINSFFEKGYDLSQFIKLSIGEIRKILLVRTGIETNSLAMEEEEEIKIKEWAQNISLKELLRMIKIFNDADEYLKIVAMPQLALEMAIIEIIRYIENGENRNNKDNRENKANEDKSVQLNKIKNNNKKISVKKNLGKGVDKIIALWPKIVDNTRKDNSSLSAFLKMCVPLSVKNDKIVLGTKFKLYADKIEQKKEIIQKNIFDICQKKYTIICQKVTSEDEVYKNHLNKLSQEEDKIEESLYKNTLEVFGDE